VRIVAVAVADGKTSVSNAGGLDYAVVVIVVVSSTPSSSHLPASAAHRRQSCRQASSLLRWYGPFSIGLLLIKRMRLGFFIVRQMIGRQRCEHI